MIWQAAKVSIFAEPRFLPVEQAMIVVEAVSELHNFEQEPGAVYIVVLVHGVLTQVEAPAPDIVVPVPAAAPVPGTVADIAVAAA